MGLRRQAASHLQHPSGPAEVSRLLSVSDARVWSVDMEEMSLMEEEGGRLSLLFTAAPVLRESTAAGGYNVTESRRKGMQKHRQRASSAGEHPQSNPSDSMMRRGKVRTGCFGIHRKKRSRQRRLSASDCFSVIFQDIVINKHKYVRGGQS